MLRIPVLAAIAKILSTLAFAAGPNVILVMTDDQGYGDLSCHGSPHVKTPALDVFRSESTSLDHFFVSPTCAPTRSALMTGLHEFSCGISHTIMGRSLLRPGIPTMPEMFRAAGYRTGIFGKWHLGDNVPCRPEDRGFDDVFVHGGGGIGQTPDYWGNGYFDPMIRRRGGWEKTSGYCTDVFFKEARAWMEKQIGEQQPFFLYLATNAPHAPYIPPVKGSKLSGPAAFHAMIESIDSNFKMLMDALEKSGAATNTVVIFMTDNGSAVGAWNAGMKGKKGTPDEGGVRVPCFVRWPGKVAAGKVVPELAAHIDLLPTLTSLCGVPRPEGWTGDGADLAKALLGEDAFPQGRTFFTQVGRWPGDAAAGRFKGQNFSVRDGRWRLVGLELFDMVSDPGQKTDLFRSEPKQAQRLLTEYGRWWNRVFPVVREPVRYRVGSDDQAVVRLTAHDWWPSKEAESRGAESLVTHDAIRKFLKARQVAGTRNPLPATSGHWKIDVVQEGNYELSFSLVPPEAEAAERTAIGQLNAGLAHIRAGQEELQLEVQKGATSIRIPIDLDPGPVDLEVWLDGQLLNDRILGAFFVTMERKGPRKAPKPEIHAKPLK
ncbi:arylsulfatase [Luteolibacter marinus]|uniref:arylsulfatase n=1 Tax=Luteolibacter marinus TaxID=2776705 RepID=UPI0018663E03|nr:arylsulfatase [Luteolibacter marinus]